MIIKDYKCKCGHNDFFFADKGSQKGIYCTYCGKWFKWADKDEQNLTMKQEPRKGHWYRQTNDYVDYYECSECGMAMGIYDVKNYCPNCGSRNEVEE